MAETWVRGLCGVGRSESLVWLYFGINLRSCRDPYIIDGIVLHWAILGSLGGVMGIHVFLGPKLRMYVA